MSDYPRRAAWLLPWLLAARAGPEPAPHCANEFIALPVQPARCTLVLWRHVTKAGGTTVRVAFERLSVRSGAAWVHVARQERLSATPPRCVFYASKGVRQLAIGAFDRCARGGEPFHLAMEYHVPPDDSAQFARHALYARGATAALGKGAAVARAVLVVVIRNPLAWLQSEWVLPAADKELVRRGNTSLLSWIATRAETQCVELATLSGLEGRAEASWAASRADAGINLAHHAWAAASLPADRAGTTLTAEGMMAAHSARGGWARLCRPWSDAPSDPLGGLARAEIERTEPLASLAPLAPRGVSAAQTRALQALLAPYDVLGVTERLGHTLGVLCARAGIAECPINVKPAHFSMLKACAGSRAKYCTRLVEQSRERTSAWTVDERIAALGATRADRVLHAHATRALDASLAALPAAVRAAVEAGTARRRPSAGCGLPFALRRSRPAPRTPPAAQPKARRRRRRLRPAPVHTASGGGGGANASVAATPARVVRPGCCLFRQALGRDGHALRVQRNKTCLAARPDFV